MRTGPEVLAPQVDQVLGEQLGRLVALLGPVPLQGDAKPQDKGSL